MIDLDFFTFFNVFGLIWCYLNPISKKEETKEPISEVLKYSPNRYLYNELIGNVDIPENPPRKNKKKDKKVEPILDTYIKPSLEEKYQEIEKSTQNYRVLDKFITMWVEDGHNTYEDFDYILSSVHKDGYKRILLDLTNSEIKKYYEQDDFLVLNLEFLISSLKNKTPILINKTKPTLVH